MSKQIESRLGMKETVRLYSILESMKDELIADPKTYCRIAAECSVRMNRPISASSVTTMCKEIGIPSARGTTNHTLGGLRERVEKLEKWLEENFNYNQ